LCENGRRERTKGAINSKAMSGEGTGRIRIASIFYHTMLKKERGQ